MFWWLLVVGIVPLPLPVSERCDVIELNHCYNDEGDYLWSQFIFWDLREDGLEHEVIDHRVVVSEFAMPVDNKLVVFDEEEQVLRKIESKSTIQTWTIGDTEVCERDRLLPQYRRGLLRSYYRMDVNSVKGSANARKN